MLEHPHFDSHSIQARICLAVAIIGGTMLVAVAITSVYFTP
jgi:hypothetical protein